ncbi:unnamed protein product [Echinostoma caproni]|uniref:RIH_assoc domain-containing protein n=1 Tax=Echinostoma caproni TaxID=27848 RepID=A0A183AC72_9TREM|nr:unnamed protein product [Echinostoma caproni]
MSSTSDGLNPPGPGPDGAVRTQARRRFTQVLTMLTHGSGALSKRKRLNSLMERTTGREVDDPVTETETAIHCVVVTPQTHQALVSELTGSTKGGKSSELTNRIEQFWDSVVSRIDRYLGDRIQDERIQLVNTLCGTENDRPTNAFPVVGASNLDLDRNAFVSKIIQHAYHLALQSGSDQFTRLLDLMNSMLKSIESKDSNHPEALDSLTKRQEFLAKHGLCELIVRCMSDTKIGEATFMKALQIQFYNALTNQKKTYGEFFSVFFRRLHTMQTQFDRHTGLEVSGRGNSKPRNGLRMSEADGGTHPQPISSSTMELIDSITPLLKFMRALCARHNEPFQNLFRHQPENVTSYNLVEETQMLLLGFSPIETTELNGSLQQIQASCSNRPEESNTRPRGTRMEVAMTTAFIPGQLDGRSGNKATTDKQRAGQKRYADLCWITDPPVAQFFVLILSCLTAFCEGPCTENQELVASPGAGCLEAVGNAVLSKLPSGDHVDGRSLRLYNLITEVKSEAIHYHYGMSRQFKDTHLGEKLQTIAHQLYILVRHLFIDCPSCILPNEARISAIDDQSGCGTCATERPGLNTTLRSISVSNAESTTTCALVFFSDRTAQIECYRHGLVAQPAQAMRV